MFIFRLISWLEKTIKISENKEITHVNFPESYINESRRVIFTAREMRDLLCVSKNSNNFAIFPSRNELIKYIRREKSKNISSTAL